MSSEVYLFERQSATTNPNAADQLTGIPNLSNRVKRSKDIGEKLDLIASENGYPGALGLAVDRFLAKDRS